MSGQGKASVIVLLGRRRISHGLLSSEANSLGYGERRTTVIPDVAVSRDGNELKPPYTVTAPCTNCASQEVDTSFVSSDDGILFC